jgi:hypothetical protein
MPAQMQVNGPGIERLSIACEPSHVKFAYSTGIVLI